jgi:hypothetical protein
MASIVLYSLIVAVLATSGISFEVVVHYPRKISSMYLRGDQCALSWDKGVEMKSVGDNKWSVSINCPPSADKIEMKVLVDDKVWMLGSNHHANPLISSTDIYPWFYTYSGSLSIIERVFSKELNNTRDVIFYTPPSYFENTLKRYSNVLVMHDGQNLFDKKTAYMGNAWMCQDALDDSIIGGKSDEVLVVGPYNTVSFTDNNKKNRMSTNADCMYFSFLFPNHMIFGFVGRSH